MKGIIMDIEEKRMKSTSNNMSAKRPVNLFLNEDNVQRAKRYTDNLSATVDTLLADFVSGKESAQQSRQRRDDAVAEAWNHFEATHASFADEHATL